MNRLVVLAVLAACGDSNPVAAIDARPDTAPMIDAPMIDAPDIDAPMIDAMLTPTESVEAVRDAASGTVDLDVVDVTVTYLKPFVTGATAANDPAGFTVQVGATGPALFVAVDPATLTTLTPALTVGDVVSFKVTEKDTSGSSPRATMISGITRSTTATNVAPLVQDLTAATGITAMVDLYESELVDVTAATIADAWGNSGNAFQRAHITTTGQSTIDNNFQLRIPTTFRDSLVTTKDLEIGCVVAIHRTPVNRFNAQFQVSAFTATDLTVTSCPAPTVASAAAVDNTHVTITFSRNIDMATVMANGSQFTIGGLAVSAAAVTGARTVSLTTAAQSAISYTVTVSNTVKDVANGAVGTPNTAMFTGAVLPIPTVMMATAMTDTAVQVTFTRNIDMASVMANGSQFTIAETATPANTLAVTAANVNGMVVTLTTASQTPNTMYTVTVANTVTDTNATPVGAPNTATFSGFLNANPTVVMATATGPTTVQVTFTRNIDLASIMMDGSQFPIFDNVTPTANALVVTAASVAGPVVTLTTAAQIPGVMYRVTVANSVTGNGGSPVGAPLVASFLGYVNGVTHLVINEIDYDNVGTDTAEYIEIYNPTTAAISLSGLRVVLVNGNTTAAPALYSGGAGVFDLSSLASLAPGQYLVIGASTLVGGLPSSIKALAFPGAQDQVQNGPRDAAYLVNVGNAGMSIAPTIVDSITYQGNTTGNLTYDAAGQNIVLMPEGTASTSVDSNTAAGALCRNPNAADTNNNATDIKFCTATTPGTANTL